jgi:hypothetical protein
MPIRPKTHRRPQQAPKHVVTKRENSTQRGYGHSWQQARVGHLRTSPLCVNHLTIGEIVKATEVDHITPHKGDLYLFWDSGNWQALCKECHSQKTAREDGGTSFVSMMPSYLIKPCKPLTVVCGPPAAGKTTLALSMCKPSTLLIDLDSISLAKFGVGLLLDRTPAQLKELITIRNRKLNDYCKGATPHTSCVLVATCGTFKERMFWANLGATVVQLHPGVDTCIDRVQARGLHPRHEARLIAVIKAWG